MPGDEEILCFGTFELDPVRLELRDTTGRVELHERPLRVLLHLIRNRDRLVPKEELLSEIWPESAVTDASVSTAIAEVRRALGDDAHRQVWLRTVRGEGFRFVGTLDESTWGAEKSTGRMVFAAAVVVLLALAAYAWLRPGTPAPARGLVVLPFDDLSADGDQGHLALGMTEELINSLTRIRDLRVIGRTSGQVAKAQGLDVAEIGSRLGVDSLIEGSVRKAGGRVRITVQLIDTAGGAHIWSERYDRPVGDVLVLQDEIAGAVAKRLELEIAGVTSRPPIGNVQAYELALIAQSRVSQLSEEGIRAGIAQFDRALTLDPDLAIAHAGLAGAYDELCSHGFDPCAEMVPRSQAAVERALDLDPELAYVQFVLGKVLLRQYDWGGAESAYRRAHSLGGHPLANSLLGFMLVRVGRTEEGLAELERAIHQDPLAPSITMNGAIAHALVGDPDRARVLARRGLVLAPGNPTMGLGAFTVYSWIGDSEMQLEALSALALPPAVESAMRESIAEGDARTTSAAWLEYLVDRSGAPCTQHGVLGANLRMYIGDTEGALACLEEGYRRHSLHIGAFLKVSPTWDPLRDDPRFQAILTGMGLAD